MKLIIVESPKKSQTFTRYLGNDYLVLATKGHVRDLATTGPGRLGVEINNNFKPIYKVEPSKASLLRQIKTSASKASEIYLATDPDREGEAIAWHLVDYLDLDVKKTKRLEFHEITREALKDSLANPRLINMDLVNSQETRRILDRIIGFKLSSLLQKKTHSPSAGRVQSVTLKMITDHEQIITAFVPEEYWEIFVRVKICKQEYNLKLTKVSNKIPQIQNEKDAKEIFARLGDKLTLNSVQSRVRRVSSKPPFKTSTLQQEAANRFRYSASRTLAIAQTLYEGVQIDDELVGLITYIRTDSTRLSLTYLGRAQAYIRNTFGQEYIGYVKNEPIKGRAQDAHEAIRPTSNHRSPDKIAKYLTRDQLRIYRLIYNRALASLMADGKDEITSAQFMSNDLEFRFDTKKVLFDGYRKLYEEEDDTICTPETMKEGETLKILKKEVLQKFTSPPARYSEARVVQLMEEAGIGRPSTYASTINLLFKRKYIEKTKQGLKPTELGTKTSVVMAKYFPELVDLNYTAKMEDDLDKIQYGEIKHTELLNDFYFAFDRKLKDTEKIMYKDPVEEIGEACPRCGGALVIKHGRHGKFIGCSNFPKCKYTRSLEPNKETGEDCPKCSRPLVHKQFSKTKSFIGCSGYPDCDYIKPQPKSKKTYSSKKKK